MCAHIVCCMISSKGMVTFIGPFASHILERKSKLILFFQQHRVKRTESTERSLTYAPRCATQRGQYK